jgi:hypothetical protein
VMNQPLWLVTCPQGLFQGIEHQLGLERTSDAPSEDATGKDIGDKGNLEKAHPGGDRGDISHP